MSCQDEYDTCGSKLPAKCVPYFGLVNEQSSLTDDKCKNMHKVAEDIYEQLSDLYGKISLEGLTSECIDLEQDDTIKSIFQKLLDKSCESNNCCSSTYSGVTDPCSGEVNSPNGLTYYSFANGNLVITSSSDWNYGSNDLYEDNMRTKVLSNGTYKITVEVTTPLTGTDEILAGIAKNNVMPTQDFSTLDGNFSIRRLTANTPKTLNFIKQLEAGDVIKLGFKNVIGTPTVTSSIFIVEKIA